MDCFFLWCWLVCVCTNHFASWRRVFLAVSGLFALFPHLRLLSSLPSLSPLNETHHKRNGAVSILGVCVSDMRYWTVITYGPLPIFVWFHVSASCSSQQIGCWCFGCQDQTLFIGSKALLPGSVWEAVTYPERDSKAKHSVVRKRWITVVHTF